MTEFDDDLAAENAQLRARLIALANSLGLPVNLEQPLGAATKTVIKASRKMSLTDIVAEGNHKVWCSICHAYVPENSTLFGNFTSLDAPAHFCKSHFNDGLHSFKEFRLKHERSLKDYEPEPRK